jgi:hypothetical protein
MIINTPVFTTLLEKIKMVGCNELTNSSISQAVYDLSDIEVLNLHFFLKK